MRRGPLALLLVVALEAPALADAPDAALAQSLFEQATELVRQGRYAEACPKLAESQRLDPAGGTLLNLGICYEKEERYTSAYLTYTELLGVSMRDGHKEREQIARERIAAVQPKQSKVVISVPPAIAKLEGLEVRFDGAVVRDVVWGTPTAIDMGEHAVVVSAPGRAEARTTVHVDAPGVSYEVKVPEPTPLERPRPAPAPQPRVVVDVGRRAVGWSLVGLGVAALGAGFTAGVVAIDQHGQANSLCTPTGCDPRYLGPERTAADAATVATVSFIGAGVAIAAGVILVLTSRSVTFADASRVALRFP